MRLRSTQVLQEHAQAGVEVCTAHGPNCQKYPDHPLVREASKPDPELAEMIRAGRIKLGRPAPEYPRECKTRRLSDDELRQRREHADAVREAHRRKKLPPTWGHVGKIDAELDRMIREGRARQARENHTQDVREGYGDAVPEFEEME